MAAPVPPALTLSAAAEPPPRSRTRDQRGPRDALDYLARFCIISPLHERRFRHAFRTAAAPGSAAEEEHVPAERLLSIEELKHGLRLASSNAITAQETDYVLSILDVFSWPAEPGCVPALTRPIDYRLFSVVCAFSVHVVGLEGWVRRHIAHVDCAALRARLQRAKDLFYCNDPLQTGRIAVDDLRLELRAGRVRAEHEASIVARLQREGRDHMTFIDFLAHIPLFMMIHDAITDNPLNDTRTL